MVHKKAISRLSRYRKALLRLRDLGFVNVFSDTLGEAVGVTAAQVRKDFSLFGITGRRRGGYRIDDLIDDLQRILGMDHPNDVVIAGVGNLGKALMEHRGFEKEDIHIVAGFDIDPAKVKKKFKIPVFPIETLPDFVKEHRIKLGIIAVPEVAAQSVCDLMLSAGIRGILNFTTVRFKGAESAVINNVYLQVELENVIYFMNALDRDPEGGLNAFPFD